jgi:hypothetical protein
MQEHGQRAGAIKSGLRGIRRRGTSSPFEDQRCRHMRDRPFRGKIREGVQGYLLRGELLSKSSIELDEAINVVMYHDAYPGHACATSANISTSTLA